MLNSRLTQKFTCGLQAFALLVAVSSAQAQQSARIARVGILGGGSASVNAARIEAFRRGLRDLGYVEGKSIVVEQRWADGKIDRLPALAADFVRLKADVIVSAGPTVTRAAKEANTGIPIVMSFDDDPVGSGFVASLARPGGNITGLSTLSPDLSGKQLELLKEIVPSVARVAVLGSLAHPGTAQTLKAIEGAARSFKVQLQYLDVMNPKAIEDAFASARKERADAIVVLTSVPTNTQRPLIVDLAAKGRLPAIYYTAEWVEAGGLLTYGASFPDLFRRAAGYVDRILKGAKPGDLPVEQPTKFELVINLKTAKQIGLTIPPNVLARADKVIK
jgi:putative ABC transport system substrate-binding protein